MLIEQRLWQKMRCQWQAYGVISIPFIVTYFVSQLIVSRFIREETTDIFTGTIIPFVSLILMLLVFQILQIIWLRIVNSGPNKTMEQAIDITENGITYWHKGNADFIAGTTMLATNKRIIKGCPLSHYCGTKMMRLPSPQIPFQRNNSSPYSPV